MVDCDGDADGGVDFDCDFVRGHDDEHLPSFTCVLSPRNCSNLIITP